MAILNMKSIKKNNSFCKAPFNSIEILPEGKLRVCCKMSKDSIMKNNHTAFFIPHDKIQDAWNSEWMNTLRKKFIEGKKPTECQQCWDDEKANIVSYRQQISYIPIQNLKKPVIKNLVLKLSNKCNCACRICNFFLSSLWEQELKKTNRWDNKYEYFVKENKIEKFSKENWEIDKEIFSEIDQLMIYGGEPLINFEILKILDYLINENLSKNITLVLNTNATIINKKIIEKLSKFKKILLHFSIDDLEDRYDYQRWPAKSNSVFSSLREMHDTYEIDYLKFEVILYCTISVFNILYIDKLLNVFKTFNKFKVNIENLIYEPEILSIFNFPEEIKIQILKILEKQDWPEVNYHKFDSQHHKRIIMNFLNLKKSIYSQENYIEKFQNFLKIDDQRRNQDWRIIFPELYNLLKT